MALSNGRCRRAYKRRPRRVCGNAGIGETSDGRASEIARRVPLDKTRQRVNGQKSPRKWRMGAPKLPDSLQREDSHRASGAEAKVRTCRRCGDEASAPDAKATGKGPREWSDSATGAGWEENGSCAESSESSDTLNLTLRGQEGEHQRDDLPGPALPGALPGPKCRGQRSAAKRLPRCHPREFRGMRIRKDLPDPTAKSGDAAAVNIVATGRKPVAGQPAQSQDAPGAAPKPTDGVVPRTGNIRAT